MKLQYLMIAPLLLAAAACHEDATGPGGNGPIDGVELDVIGLGSIDDRFTAELAVVGDIAYTTTWSNRRGNAGDIVNIWDISDDVPALVDSLVIHGADTTSDVQVSDDGQLLVVSTEYADTGSIVIYDIADPRTPVRLARHASTNTAPAGVHTVKLARVDNTLYAFLAVNGRIGAPSGLAVVDLSDPANPVEVLWKPMGVPFLHDTFIRDGILFTALWNDGLGIWDIGGERGGTPANPVLIAKLGTVGAADASKPRAHNVWWYHAPDGSQRYVFVGEEGPSLLGDFSSGDIHVVDITDIENPVEVAFFHVNGAGTHNFAMDEEAGRLYAAYYNGGVRVIDVTGDLGACAAEYRSEDGRCDLRAAGREVAVGLAGTDQLAVWGVTFTDDRIYASDMYHGLYVLDRSALTEAPE